MKKIVLILLPVGVYLLHQDCWNWKKYQPLVFGFIPVGLAYHAVYSLVAAGMMWVLVKLAWPEWLERVTKHEDEPGKDDRR